MEFAKISRLQFEDWIKELRKVESQLRAKGVSEDILTSPEYIQEQRDNFRIWGNLEKGDWQIMQEHLVELIETNSKLENSPCEEYLPPEG